MYMNLTFILHKISIFVCSSYMETCIHRPVRQQDTHRNCIFLSKKRSSISKTCDINLTCTCQKLATQPCENLIRSLASPGMPIHLPRRFYAPENVACFLHAHVKNMNHKSDVHMSKTFTPNELKSMKTSILYMNFTHFCQKSAR